MRFDDRIWILDGAMGTVLQRNGLEVGGVPELLSLTNPQLIENIHTAYFDAGADIVYANTFGANRHKLERTGHSVAEVVTASVQIAKRAALNHGLGLVALDIGPIGQMLEPAGTLRFEEAYDIFAEMIVAGRDAGADIVVFETMSDPYEIKAGILAAKENCGLPVLATMSFADDGRTFMGCSLSEAAALLQGLGVDALGLNCSIGPKEAAGLAIQLCGLTNLPVILKPNAGLPDPVTNSYNVGSSDFADAVELAYQGGVNIFGGCCGSTPEFISELSSRFKGRELIQREYKPQSRITSGIKTVVVDGVRIIGERINPTGKKLMREAIQRRDYDYLLARAIEQISAGAHILDVNVSVPHTDEPQIMSEAVKHLQAVVDTPLQLDSSNPEALEAGLRVYNGKPIINSINAEEAVMEKILPLVKKYGAAVVGLTLDERGIPEQAEERLALARKIMNRALEYGIAKEDIYIDCLTLTASAQQSGALETLRAVRMVKEELGLKTLLGVSNISFGLPERELINTTFLTMALHAGLDLPIINPNLSAMTGAIDAFNVLANHDVGSNLYIEKHGNKSDDAPKAKTPAKQGDLFGAVVSGLQDEAKHLAVEMLATIDGMDIIDNYVIKALDLVGERYEKGEFFLPQMLRSAAAAGAALDVIKENMSKSGQMGESKGKIILATVKGDIHDIGKNIVKLILQNYGYDVIDLGRDVPIETVVERAAEEKVRMVGLSALMTTTLKNMELTIEALRANPQTAGCKIVSGGAVLTEEYAKLIGADYYARDAKVTVAVAKEIFGN